MAKELRCLSQIKTQRMSWLIQLDLATRVRFVRADYLGLVLGILFDCEKPLRW